MAKYRGWVAQVMDIEEFDSEIEARAWAMAARDEWQKKNLPGEIYFEIDDCGSTDEEEEL